MKKIIVLGIIVLAIIGITRSGNNTGPQGLLADSATITLYTIDDVVTSYGFLEISFDSDIDGTYYANAVANLGGPSSEEFIVNNFTARIADGYSNRFSFSIPEYFDPNVGTVDVKVALSDTLLSDDTTFDTLEAKSFVANVETVPIVEQFGLNIPGASEDLKRGVLGLPVAHAQLAGHDLEAPGRNVDVPDLMGGPMDCFAIATANNLISLANEHGFDADFPDPTDMIEELKEDMQWDNGILNRNFLTGKAAFVDRYNLPIETTEIKRPSMKDLIDALNSGGAVEVSTSMIRSESKKESTGHVLTGLGAFEDGDEAGIHVHDPATPDGADMLGITASGGETPFLIVEYPMWDGLMIIDAIFIQTWTAEDPEPLSDSGIDVPTEESNTAVTEPVSDTEPDVSESSLPGIDNFFMDISFAHTNPGVSSEVYVAVTTKPGHEVTVKLKGPSIEPPSEQVITSDDNGVAHFTWTIYQFGIYNAFATVEGGGDIHTAASVTVN